VLGNPTCNTMVDFSCPLCGHNSPTLSLRRRHLIQVHRCYRCHDNVLYRRFHICRPVQIGFGQAQIAPFILTDAALDNTFQVYTLNIEAQIVSVEQLFTHYLHDFRRLLNILLNRDRNLKVQILAEVFMHQNFTGDEVFNYLSSRTMPLLHASGINLLLFTAASQIIINLNGYIENGSSWSVVAFTTVEVKISKYRPFRIGSGIKTPNCYFKQHGLINIMTDENKCFVYCVIAVYLKFTNKKESERFLPYKNFMRDNYNYETRTFQFIDFSMLNQQGFVQLETIPLFERKNPDFSVNVYGHCDEEECIFPLKICKQEKINHVDLMLVTENTQSHFILIQDFNTFMQKKNKLYYCKSCLLPFRELFSLNEHKLVCLTHSPQRLEFPKASSIKYRIGDKSFKHSSYVVADFETYMQPLEVDNESSGMKKVSQHVPLSVCYSYVTGGHVEFYRYHDGPDCDKWFIEELMGLADSHLKKVV
jgi:hypothetical protein